jgi:hypothetical protein
MADLGDGFPLASDDEVIARIAKHYGVPEEDALFMLAVERRSGTDAAGPVVPDGGAGDILDT